MILQRRIYYEMLRHRAGLLVFEKAAPLRDPALLVLLWCMVHAFAHLLHKVFVYSGREGVSATLGASHATVDFQSVTSALESEKPTLYRMYKDYMLPTALFLVFLKKTYSNEDSLVTLQQYLDEDPQRARQALDSLEFVTEKSAAAAAQYGLRLRRGLTEEAALVELVD